PCRLDLDTRAALAAEGAKSCLTRNACSRWFAAAPAAPPIFLQANSAAPEKTQETSSPTNPTRRAQTAHVRGQVPEPQYARANLVHARSPQTAGPAGVRKRHGHRWTYRSLRPCRIVPHLASNSPARDHRDKAPCSARTESARARGFPARFSRAGSQPLPLALRPVLRRADEHFDQIIVQSVVELTLEGPFKLWMIDHASPCFAEQSRRGAAGGAAADNRNIIIFHRQKVAEFAGKQRVAHASHVLAKTSRLRGLFYRDCFGETRKPARGTRALPGTLRQRGGSRGLRHAAPCKEHAFVLTNQQMKLIDRFVSRELIVNLLFAIF